MLDILDLIYPSRNTIDIIINLAIIRATAKPKGGF